MKNIDYYFTPVSPFTYLGHDRFVAMAKKHGASITVKPVDFGKVFSVSGGLPLKQRAPQRQAYRMFELKRWRELLDARERSSGDGVKLAGAIMRAVWAEERDVSDAATLSAIATEQGLDAPALAARAATEDVGARYQALTQEAIDRQVFGAPTYIYRDEPFWGQDRLDFLERALAK